MFAILTGMGRTEEAERSVQVRTKPVENQKRISVRIGCVRKYAGVALPQCKKSIKDIITTYLSPTDPISMMVFNSQVSRVFSDKTKGSNLGEMMQSIDAIRAEGGTAFYDALKIAIEGSLLDKKWIVALTDGDDGGSRYTPADVIKAIERSNRGLIVITVSSLKNRELIAKICTAANKKNVGKLIEVAHNMAEIEQVFKKVIQMITGELHVKSL